jgi:hypothetical protein
MNSPPARDDYTAQDDLKAAVMRARLDEIRFLAAQSGLLALNAALESADARAGGAPAGDMDRLAAQAGSAAAEADKAVKAASAVEALLQQIQAGAALARRCG